MSDMIKERWKKAHKEGVHVTRLKPDRNGKPETGKKPTHQ